MITIQRAVLSDAEILTSIMKITFDEEAKKWLLNEKTVDYNIQPPGHSSVEMTKYMIEELIYYKIIYHQVIVGVIIVTISGVSYGRLDRIFIHPAYQGNNIGSRVIELIEEEFPKVRMWDLETSSRQVNNHHFYKKMGYELIYESEDEFCYIKKIEIPHNDKRVIENKDLTFTQYENCNLSKSDYYQVNLESSSISNSNLKNGHISNCNNSHSKYQNINLKHSLFADSNLSYSKMRLVSLEGVRFMDTSLGDNKEPIIFERCELQGTKIVNSNLKNLQIHNSDITGMTIDNISVEELLNFYKKFKN